MNGGSDCCPKKAADNNCDDRVSENENGKSDGSGRGTENGSDDAHHGAHPFSLPRPCTDRESGRAAFEWQKSRRESDGLES